MQEIDYGRSDTPSLLRWHDGDPQGRMSETLVESSQKTVRYRTTVCKCPTVEITTLVPRHKIRLLPIEGVRSKKAISSKLGEHVRNGVRIGRHEDTNHQ